MRDFKQFLNETLTSYNFTKMGTPPNDKESPLKNLKPGEFFPKDMLEGNYKKAIRTEKGYIAILKNGNIEIHEWNNFKDGWETVTLFKEELNLLKKILK